MNALNCKNCEEPCDGTTCGCGQCAELLSEIEHGTTAAEVRRVAKLIDDDYVLVDVSTGHYDDNRRDTTLTDEVVEYLRAYADLLEER